MEVAWHAKVLQSTQEILMEKTYYITILIILDLPWYTMMERFKMLHFFPSFFLHLIHCSSLGASIRTPSAVWPPLMPYPLGLPLAPLSLQTCVLQYTNEHMMVRCKTQMTNNNNNKKNVAVISIQISFHKYGSRSFHLNPIWALNAFHFISPSRPSLHFFCICI